MTGDLPPPALFASRRRGETCVSDLILDRLACGELSDDESPRVREHLAACTACAGALERITGDRAGFEREVDAAAMVSMVLQRARDQAAVPDRIPGRRGFPRRFVSPLMWPVTLSAAAALALMWVVRPPEHADEGAGGQTSPLATRSKGGEGFALAAYVKFKDQDQPGTLHLGQPLSAGDRIAFRVSSDRPGHLAVLAVDGAAHVSVYYPPGPRSEPLGAGRDMPLHTAVELDAAPGPEVILGLRCEREFVVADMVDRVAAAAARAVKAGQPATDLGALGTSCAETRLTINKAAAR